ncbi:MAG: GTP 3',8-cyclase MoaA [Planctomycetota bacterium]
MQQSLPIVDSFGRRHTSLRISVTDRCNIRCVYCMPEFVKFLPQRDLLTFEEIERLVKMIVPLGVNQIRLTGGEPLVRSQLDLLVSMLVNVKGIDEVAMTTNAVLLDQQAQRLKDAGLRRLNISLDTIDANLFQQITRRDVLPKVLRGIDAALDVGFEGTRINAVPVPLLADEHLIALARFTKSKRLELRFIEYMPLDGDQQWNEGAVRSGLELRRLISKHVGTLIEAPRHDINQPAVDYQYQDNGVKIGFIDSVTSPFCQNCNRMRITAEGKFRNCLFSNAEWDLKTALRSGTDEEVISLIRSAITAKKRGHGTDDGSFFRPDRAMYQIGG